MEKQVVRFIIRVVLRTITMEPKLAFGDKISTLKGKSWLWITYPVLSVVFTGLILFTVAETAFFLSTEVEKTFVGQAVLERNLLRLNIDGYNEIAGRIGLPPYTAPVEEEE